MTPEQIRAAIAARPDLSGVTDSQAIADALSVGRTKVAPKMVSARGLAEHLGAIPAEVVLMRLEGARDAMLASADQQQRVFGSLLRRQLSFLAQDGLDFGSTALRSMLDQFAATNILTSAEVTALKAIALEPDPVSEWDVRSAIYHPVTGDLLI